MGAVTGATATMMLVRGLVERDALARLQMTPQGEQWMVLTEIASFYNMSTFVGM
jgi:hypothetical protein